MSKWPGAVLFDFDGVIVNSEPLHFYALNEVLKREGVELSEEQYYRELIGFDDRGAIRRAFELHGRTLDAPTLLRVTARKSRVAMDLIGQRKFGALPGVEPFVRGLWRHCPLAICSGALRDEIEAMLEGVNLRDCFRVIVAAEDVAVGKPDPSGYVLATKLLAEKANVPLKPADCLIVEDAAAVIRNVKALGYPTLAVATSAPADQLSDADHVVRTLAPAEVAKRVPSLKRALTVG
ncbi:MAG TPA: HAD family phosphatase [Tepidisphaeraceae bacterium]|nr:HAD family phosphatase [Tepidisphaeraceae bacterium]